MRMPRITATLFYAEVNQVGPSHAPNRSECAAEIGAFSASALSWRVTLAKTPHFKPGNHFPRNLAPNLTQYGTEHRKGGSKYEQSRWRNDNHNFSASPSLAWARRSIGRRDMARTHRNTKPESKTKRPKPSLRVSSRLLYA